MSGTLLRNKNQITLPVNVVKAAGLATSDRIAWRFEQGEIRGRKLVRAAVRARAGKVVQDRRTGLVYFDSDVSPEEAEDAALSANLDRQ